MIMKQIISGGQTGVDRAALDFARNASIPCGGWCPPGRLAEDGPIPIEYPLQEMPTGGYRERTWQNAKDSDGTLIIYKGQITGGTAETVTAANANRKPVLKINADATTPEDAAIAIQAFLQNHNIHQLNIAGPRASQWKDGYAYTQALLTNVFARNT